MRFTLIQLIYFTCMGWALMLSQSGVNAQTFSALLTNNVVEPFGVAVDQNNFHYVTDSAQNRILRLFPDTGEKVNFVGFPGSGNSGDQEGKGSQARFYSPQGIIFVSETQPMYRPSTLRAGTQALGDLLVVADSGNHRIRIVNLALDPESGDPVRETHLLAGSSVGFQNGDTPQTSQFNTPSGIALDTLGNLWISDSLNQAVRYLTPEGQMVTASTDFFLPSGIALDPGNRVYIADSGTHSIKRIAGVNDTEAVLYAGSGSRFLSGFRDDLIATEARFNFPRGVLWVGGTTGLLVSDSRNGSLRNVFFNNEFGEFSVATFPNVAASGALDSPVGLGRDNDGNLLLVDMGANSLLRLSTVSVVQPQVDSPDIGFVQVEENLAGQRVTRLVSIVNSTFDNDVVVAIVGETGTETYYTIGETGTAIPTPGPNASSFSPSAYRDGLFEGFPPNIISPTRPDLTIRSISVQDGRLPSDVVDARIRFQVANPVVIGDDPASFIMRSATTNATIWYTVDNTSPTQGQGSARRYVTGETLNVVQGEDDILFRARAYKDGYSPSSEIAKVFQLEDIQYSTIGFDQDFTGSPGSTLVLPLSVNVTTNQVLRSLQFRVEMEPVEVDTPATPAGFRPLSRTTNDFIQVPVPSLTGTNLYSFLSYRPEENPAAAGLAIAFLGTNSSLNVSRSPEVVTLIGAPIPSDAREGSRYRLKILDPSGTLDGDQLPASIRAADDRFITITSQPYMVGDTAVADWYNAGSFGSGDLNNNDVNNVMKASLGIQKPYEFSDLFDAMDSFPEDQPGIPGGDGQIRFLDVQLTMVRSLGLRQDRYFRIRGAGGVRNAFAADAILNSSGLINTVHEPNQSAEDDSDAEYWNVDARLYAQLENSSTVEGSLRVPIYVETMNGATISGLQFRVSVQPVTNDQSVWLNSPVVFERAPSIPPPTLVDGTGIHEVACVWNLSSFSPELSGEKRLGDLVIPVAAMPLNTFDFKIRFYQFDGAGGSTLSSSLFWDSLEVETLSSLLHREPGSNSWTQETDQQSPEWSMKYFGSGFELDTRAIPDRDPDQDGLLNWQEYQVGSDPLDAESALKIDSITTLESGHSQLQWRSVPGRSYYVEKKSINAGPEGWGRVSDPLIGNGGQLNWTDSELNFGSELYRLKLAQ